MKRLFPPSLLSKLSLSFSKVFLYSTFLLFCILFFSSSASAATRTWDGGGADNNWSTAANWSSDTLPTSSDDVVFNGTSTKDAVIDSTFTVASISMNAGYSGIVTQSANFNVYGNFTVNAGTYTHSSGVISFAGFGPTTFDTAANAITFKDVAFNKNNTGWGISLQDSEVITVTGTATFTDGYINRNGGTGTVKLTNGGSFASTWDGGNAKFLIKDSAAAVAYTVNAGAIMPVLEIDDVNATVTGTGSGTINYNQTFTLKAGTFQGGSSSTTHSFNQPVSVTGGTLNLSTATVANFTSSSTYNQSGGTVTLGTYNPTFSNTFTLSGGSFDASNVSILTFTSNFTLSGGTLVAKDSSTARFYYGFTFSSGTFTNLSTLDVQFLNSSPTTIDTGTNSLTLKNLTVNKNNSGWGVSLADAEVITVTGSATFTDGYINRNGGTGTIKLTNGGSFASTWDGGNAKFLIKDSSAAVAYTINAGAITPVLEIDDANATVTGTGSGTINYNQSFTLKSGTFQGGSSSTTHSFNQPVSITGGAMDLSTATVANFTSSSTYNQSGGTVTLGTYNPTFSNAFVLSGGTLNASNVSILTFANHFTLSGGTLVAKDSSIARFYLDFTFSSGTFTNLSTLDVQLLNSSQTTIDTGTNSLTVKNLTVNKNNSGWGVYLQASEVITVTGTLTLTDGFFNNSSTAATINPQGNVVVASTWDGGSTAFNFTGTNDQTFDLTGATGTINSDITINKASGTVTLASALLMDAASQDLTLTSGTLSLAGNNLTVNGSSGTFTVANGATLQLQGGESITANTNYPSFANGSNVKYVGTGASYTVKNYSYSKLAFAGGNSTVFSLGANVTVGNTLTLTTGIFDLAGYNITGGGTIDNDSGLTGNTRLRLRGGETVSMTADSNSGTVEYTGSSSYSSLPLSSYYHLIFNGSGSWTLASALTVNGDLTISQGSLVTGGYAISLAGNFSNSGTFTHGNGIVHLTGADQSISGSSATTFYKLSKTVNAAHTLIFPVGVQTTISNRFTAYGTSGNLLSFRSSSNGSQASVNINKEAFQYLDVKDIKNINAERANCYIGCVDSGNNDNTVPDPDEPTWNFELDGDQSVTWDFNNPSDYSFDPLTTQVSSGLGSLIDLGGGTYTQSSPLVGFTRFREITIANPGGSILSDMQVRVSVTYDGDMNADFSDVRFLDDDNSQLSYWLQQKTNSSSAVFWVKIPSIPAAGKTIYLYYGNSSAASQSSISNTFIGGDDFNGPLDASWTQITSGGGQAATFNNGIMTKACIPGSGNCDWWAGNAIDSGIYRAWGSTTAEAIISVTSESDLGSTHTGLMLYNSSNNDGFMWGRYSASNYQVERVGAGNQCNISASSAASMLKIVNNSGTYSFYRSTDSGSTWTQCGSFTSTATMTSVGIFAKSWGGSTATANYDYFFIKKYAASQPTASVSASENLVGAPPYILTAAGGVHPSYTNLYSFSEVLGGFNTGTVYYQISNNGTDWYYHDGDNWSAISNDFQRNVAAEINAGIQDFVSDVGQGDFYFKAFLSSDGLQAVEIDSISLQYAPTNLSPNTPSSLGASDKVNGSTSANPQPTLSFTLSDSDVADTIQYRIQISQHSDYSAPVVDYTSALAAQGATSFTVGQAAGSGSYSVGSASQTLTDGNYYWRVKAIDNSNAESAYVEGNVGAVAFAVDTVVRSIDFQTTSGSGAETTASPTVTVRLGATNFVNTSVNYAVTGGTAVSNTNYTLASGTATINQGSTTTTIPLSIIRDYIDTGSKTVEITLSSPTNAQLGTNTVYTYTITNSDTAGVSVSKASVAVAEATSSTDTYTLQLDSKPVSNVVMSVTSSDTTYGVTVSPASLTFTSANWNSPQTVTVTAVNDTRYEPSSTATISHAITTGDGTYTSSMSIASVTANITDDENQPALSINDNSLTEGNSGTSNLTFTVTLDHSSTESITVDYTTANGTATAGSDYTATSGTLTFAAGETSKTVDVSVAGDKLVESDETFTLTLSNPSNATIADNSGTGTITNDDHAPVLTDPGNLTIKRGSSLSLTLSATDADAEAVTYSCASNCPTGLSVNSSTGVVTWTPSSTQKGTFSAVTFKAEDPNTNSDTKAIDLIVTGITLNESGSSTDVTEGNSGDDTYTVVLDSQPTADVVITLSPNAQVSVTPSTLTFTSANWSTPQTVTVTAVDDSVEEGSHLGSITHTTASADANYNSISVSTLSVNITDNDTAAVSITQSAGSTDVSESGTTDSYTVVLTSEPTQDVTITVSSLDAVYGVKVNKVGISASNSTSLTFTSVNWSTPQTITVTAVDDSRVEGAHTKSIRHTMSSSDTIYNALSYIDLNVQIADNDSAGVNISKSTASVSEDGSIDTYTVQLNSQPSSSVAVTVTASSPALVRVPGVTTATSSGVLNFDSSNWNVPQSVEVSTSRDHIQQGSRVRTLTHTSSSSDTNYNALTIASVSVTVLDVDVAGVSVSETSLTVTEGATRTYTLVLDSQPSSNVIITPTASTGLTISPSTVTFTSSNWSSPQTVTLIATNDVVVQGDRSGSISHALQTADSVYNSKTVATINVNILEDDTQVALTVSAGADKNIRNGSSVTLNAVVTPSNITPTYVWSLVSGSGTLSSISNSSTQFTAQGGGVNVVRITVNDNNGHSGTDEVSINVWSDDAVTGSDLPENVIGISGENSVVERRTRNSAGTITSLTLQVGSAQVELPEEATEDSSYTLSYTRDGKMIIGVPGELSGTGRVYFGRTSTSELSTSADLGLISRSLNSVHRSLITQNASDDFAVVTGSQENGGFGAFINSGDINGDDEDEIMVGAPSTGPYGVIYVYASNYQLIGAIFGSAEHPVSSSLVSNYLQSDYSSLFFGPNNTSLNYNLKRPTEIDAISSTAMLSGSSDFGGNIDLSDHEVDAILGDIGVLSSNSVSGYVNSVFADINGDDIPDLFLADNLGGISIYYGPVSEGDTLGANEADLYIEGAETDIGFGEAMAIGDVSGDGELDLIVGAPRYGDNKGAVCIILGPLNENIDLSESSNSIWVYGEEEDGIGSDFILSPRSDSEAKDIYTLRGSENNTYRISLNLSDNTDTEDPSNPGGRTDGLRGAGVSSCSLQKNTKISSSLQIFNIIFLILFYLIQRQRLHHLFKIRFSSK